MIRINKGVKFKVWDEDEKVMHEAEEVCRIHFDNGAPYAVLLWEGDALLNFVLYLDYVIVGGILEKEEQMKEQYPIPEWCKEDCRFRDPKAKYMPACRYAFGLKVRDDKECLTYRAE